MNISGQVSSILHHKGHALWAIAPDATVFEAIKLMAHKSVGALLVLDGEKLVGVITERDYTRKVAIKGRSSKDTAVREIVSPHVHTVTPEHSVEDCMKLMTEHRIRHLPVVAGEKVLGIISIGDLVNWTISAQNATIEQMQQYISGGYPTN